MAEERRKARDYATATEVFSHVRKFYTDLGDRRGEANVLVKLGSIYRKQKRTGPAREQVEHAIEMYSAQDDLEGLVSAYAGLGDIYYDNNEFETALAQYNQGLSSVSPFS